MTRNASNSSSLLNIQVADIYRGTKKVFDQLCLTIPVGRNTAIVGPNGAGKTTLLKVLARELYATGGSVEIYGQQRWNVWELRKRLGVVSADLQRNYSPAAEGQSVVLSGFYASINTFGHQVFTGVEMELAERLSHELGIAHLAKTPFSRMSTGEQRRHLLARALVNEPDSLILDEPTAGLDLTAQFQYLQTIRQLMQTGTTVVLVTHLIHEIPPEIEHVILLKEGRVIVDAPKKSSLTNAQLSDVFGVGVQVSFDGRFFHASPVDD
ncbi:MAG: iron complex transport system ATP-binding protein [Mariniblastus sp.]|jgi:iron complex transport system ATP-binding protein